MAKATTKKVKAVQQENEIEQILFCIKNDHIKLGKLFDKQIEKSKKSIAALSAKQDKAKAKFAKAGKGKTKPISKENRVEMEAQNNELSSQKLALKTVEAAFKKWKAEQKVTSHFEKDWRKKELVAAKKSKGAKPKNTVKKTKKVSRTTSDIKNEEKPQDSME